MLSSSFQIRGLVQLELDRIKVKQMGVLKEKAGSLSDGVSSSGWAALQQSRQHKQDPHRVDKTLGLFSEEQGGKLGTQQPKAPADD